LLGTGPFSPFAPTGDNRHRAVLYSPTMERDHPLGLAPWERWVLIGLLILCLVLAVAGRHRRQRRAYEDFLRRAKMIEQALERFAADHQGRFPPDAMFTNRPPYLDDRYLAWDPEWLIDYDVGDNRRGGRFVCLEFCGPTGKRRYFGLCHDPALRARYGRGQPIPGQRNRIWVIREEAPILPPPPRPPGGRRP